MNGKIASNVAAAMTDDELRSLLLEGRDRTVMSELAKLVLGVVRSIMTCV